MWNDLKKALGQLAPKNTVLSQLLGKALLHNISTGIQNAGALPDEKRAAERLLPIRKHREERENGIASAVPFSHFSIDAVTFDISKAPMPL